MQGASRPHPLLLTRSSSPLFLLHSKSTVTHSRTHTHGSSAGASHAPDSHGHHSLFGGGRGQRLQDAHSRPGPEVHLSEDAVHPDLQLKQSGGTVQLHNKDRRRFEGLDICFDESPNHLRPLTSNPSTLGVGTAAVPSTALSSSPVLIRSSDSLSFTIFLWVS